MPHLWCVAWAVDYDQTLDECCCDIATGGNKCLLAGYRKPSCDFCLAFASKTKLPAM